MTNAIKYTGALLLSLGFLGSMQGVFEKLLDRSGEVKTIEVPFPYLRITTQESNPKDVPNLSYNDGKHAFNESTVFVPEGFYAVLGAGLAQSAIVGPLCPCIGLFVRCESQEKALVFHVAFNDPEDVIVKINEEFGDHVKPEDLKIKIFSKLYDNLFDLPVKIVAEVLKQKKQFDMIKGMLSDRYTSKNGPFSVEGTFWEKGIRMGLFRTADKTIFVDKKLNTYSTSLVNEQIFGQKYFGVHMIPAKRAEEFIRLYDAINNFYIENYLKQDKKIDFTPERVLADRLSFCRLPDDHVGLEFLELIASKQITTKEEAVQFLGAKHSHSLACQVESISTKRDKPEDLALRLLTLGAQKHVPGPGLQFKEKTSSGETI